MHKANVKTPPGDSVRHWFAILIISVALAWYGVPAKAATRYVPSPYSTIQTAINSCNGGDTVIVAPGIYYERVRFWGKAITLKSSGGYKVTTINGSHAGSVVTFVNGEGNASVIDGFTISNGSGTWAEYGFSGGGLFCRNSSPTIKNCAVVGNNIGNGSGGGIACYNASPKIIGCIISQNKAPYGYGGGVYCVYNALPLISNCIISQNGSPGYSGLYEAGFYCDFDSSPDIESCTIAQNAGGIYCWGNGTATVSNSILWNNSDDLYGCSATYSCIQNNDAGTGNIHNNPLFVDPDKGNYHISSTSPCINTGNPGGSYSGLTDIDGQPRVLDGRVDIGADEFSSSLSWNEVSVGQLRITGDTINKISSSEQQIIGNVKINDIIRLTGTVTANTATLRVRGNGEVWIDGVPAIGNVKVYEGSWEFDGQTAATTTINRVLSGLKVVGLNVHVDAIAIVSSGVRLRGTLAMPQVLNGAQLAITGSNYIELNKTDGLKFSGALITITNASNLKFMGLPFKYSNVELRLSSSEIQLRGKLELPSILGGTTVDLSTDNNHLSIVDDGGQPKVEVAGALYIDGPVTLGPGFSIEDMAFTLDSAESILVADGTFNIPAGFAIVAGIGFRDGYFNYVHGGFAEKNYPIIYTPAGVPIVFWQDADVWVNELAPGPPPVVLGGHVAFTAGPQIEGYYLLRLDGTAEYDTGGRFTGTLDISMGGGDDPYEFASALIIIDKKYGLYVEGRMTFIGVIDASGQLRLDLQNNLQGTLRGSIKAPKWLGGRTLADAIIYAQYLDNEKDSDDYLVAEGRIGWIYDFKHAVCFDLHTGDIDWNASLDLVKEISIPPPTRGIRMFEVFGPHTFDLPPGLEGVVFEVTWDSNDTDVVLTRPDHTVITPNNVGDFPGIKYYKDVVGHKAIYGVAGPQAGTWQVELTNSQNVGGYRLRALKTTSRPTIAVIEPSHDISERYVKISWTDVATEPNTIIGLYYDTDRDGMDGTPLVNGLDALDANDTFVWDTNGVPTGIYYVYAKIDDDHQVPSFSYSVGRVIVIDQNAPPPPTNLAAAPTGAEGELLLRWTDSTEPNLHHYNVYYAPDAAGEDVGQMVIADNKDTFVLRGLIYGETYRITVQSVDDANNVGPLSEPVIVTVRQKDNHIPVFEGGIPTQATVGQLYQFQVLAEDLDSDKIKYSLVTDEPNMPEPAADISISPDGLLEWIPETNQVGGHKFMVMLDDGNLGINQRLFTITVADESTKNRPPEILSEALPLAQDGTEYRYQVVANDPDVGDSLQFVLLSGPNDVVLDANGLLEWSVPEQSGRYDFLVKVTDMDGLFALQRFTVQVDLDAPVLDVVNWGSLSASGPNSIEVEAIPVADAIGLVEYLFEVDSNSVAWQRAPTFTATGLSPNSEHTFRVKVRDASAAMNETVWSEPKSAFTLGQAPPAPILVASETNSIEVKLDAGENPPTTALVLFNASTGEWVTLSGEGSVNPVWAEAATWGTTHIGGLAPDTTYHLQSKAKNEDGIETPLSPVLIAKTEAPNSIAELTANRDWLYENDPNSTARQVTLSAAFVNDPYMNSEYTYTWQVPIDPVTGKALVLVAGGEPNDSTATYAAPEGSNDYPAIYSVLCTVTGKQTGNSVSKTFYITVYARSDLNRDGEIGYGDIARFCGYWLGAEPEADIAPKPSGDGMVDFQDFAAFADHWLEGTTP